MKTTKLFFMAALALMTAACSNDDNDLTTQQPAKAEGIPFTATISLDQSATTRALTENGTTIEATWATGEKVALIYTVSATTYVEEAEVTPQGDGTATISTTLEGSPADDTDVTIVYPASAVDGTTKDVKTNLLASQNGLLTGPGSIAEKYELRKTTTPAKLKIDGTTASLKGTVSLTNQFAIWKLTLNNSAKDLYITADGVLIAGATLASPGTEFYVAVPAVDSKTVAAVATDGSSNCWSFSKAGVSLVAGKYYQSSPTMAALGTESSADVYKMTEAGTIPDGKTVVLSGVTISSGSIICSGNANIILMGSNSVTAAANTAAIEIGGSGTTLTITGSGSLTVKGGNYAAAIGTGYANNASVAGGNIEINGGTITATGGQSSAAIGTGYAYHNGSSSNTCGTITINGGSVSATGGAAAAGIGTASANGSSNECGAITINGGTVTATGGLRSAAIGTGSANNSGSNKCGAITISTGVTSVTATKGVNSPNIIGKGNAVNSGTQTCGTITFGAAQVFDGSAWSPDPMTAGTHGGLNLAITNSDKTWTLTPAP